ncbi:MAG: L-seryl-tRNA(Sec) selenium transferase [Candidatus Acidiferrum sp.]
MSTGKEALARSASTHAELLRQLPSIDQLLSSAPLVALSGRIDRAMLVQVARETLESLRARVLNSQRFPATGLVEPSVEDLIASQVELLLTSSLQPVINATGVVLHTNLGRAPLAPAVVEEFRRTATQYTNLEYHLESGSRGKRDVHTSQLLARLIGAEAAIVVNNCAAATLLVLAALAKGGEVIVSRGELIEIGDGFRIPEIMAQSGALLREVGTTNRTRLSDYEDVLCENSRLLLRVHPSNFKISGFTEKPSLNDLAALAQRFSIPLVEDLGSGCLADFSSSGIAEPTVRASLAAGVAIVLFSADKLLGGPQAGIIAGKKELVERIRRHPLFRALRVDKLTIAALNVTLRCYVRGAWDEIPALRMIRATLNELQQRSENFVAQLHAALPAGQVQLEVVDGASLVGGGATPEQSLPTKLICMASLRYSAAKFEQRLRQPAAGLPVIARVENNRLLFDLRTVFPEQESLLLHAITAALST